MCAGNFWRNFEVRMTPRVQDSKFQQLNCFSLLEGSLFEKNWFSVFLWRSKGVLIRPPYFISVHEEKPKWNRISVLFPSCTWLHTVHSGVELSSGFHWVVMHKLSRSRFAHQRVGVAQGAVSGVVTLHAKERGAIIKGSISCSCSNHSVTHVTCHICAPHYQLFNCMLALHQIN